MANECRPPVPDHRVECPLWAHKNTSDRREVVVTELDDCHRVGYLIREQIFRNTSSVTLLHLTVQTNELDPS
ncbi:unnamed protein product [Arctogadus glacialis]